MSDKVIGVAMQPHVYILVCMQSTLPHLLNPLYCNRKQILYKLLVANSFVFEDAGFAECYSFALNFLFRGKHYHPELVFLEGTLENILSSCKQICQYSCVFHFDSECKLPKVYFKNNFI